MKRKLENGSEIVLSPFESKVQEATTFFREKMLYREEIPVRYIKAIRDKNMGVLGDSARKDDRLLGYFMLMAVAYNVPEVVAKCLLNSKRISKDVLTKAAILAFELHNVNCLKQIVGSVDINSASGLKIEPDKVLKWELECVALLSQNKAAILNFDKKTIDALIENKHFRILFYCETELGVKVDIADAGINVEYKQYKLLLNTLLPLAHCTSITDLYNSLYNPMSISGLVYDLDLNETMNCTMFFSNYLYMNADKFLDRKIARCKVAANELALTVYNALNCSKSDKESILHTILSYYSVATFSDNERWSVTNSVMALDYESAFKYADTESKQVIQALTGRALMYNGLYLKKNAALHNLLELISERTDELDVMVLVRHDLHKSTLAYHQLNMIFRFVLSAPDRDAIFAQYKKCTDVFIILCGVYGRHDVMYHLIKNEIYDLELYDNGESPIDFAAMEAAKRGYYLSYRLALKHSSFHKDNGASGHFEAIKDSSFETLYEYCTYQSSDFGDLEYTPVLNSWFLNSHYHMLYLVNEMYISDAKKDGKFNDGFDGACHDEDLGEYKLYKKVVDQKISALKLPSIACLYRTIYPKEDLDILYATLPAPLKALADQDMEWFALSPEIFFEKKVKLVFSQYFVTNELFEMLLCINDYMPFELSVMLAMHIISVSENVLTYKEQVMIAASKFTQADVDAIKIDGIEELSQEAKECVARLNVVPKNLLSLF